MAKITAKLFGVLRVDTKLSAAELEADTIEQIFTHLNAEIDKLYSERVKANPRLEHPDALSFRDALVYINGNRCTKKRTPLKDGDEVWLLSPASGG